MKTIVFSVMIGALALASSAKADPPFTYDELRQHWESANLTGSFLKQRVMRHRIIADGNVTNAPVLYIDQDEIRRSGEQTVGGVLSKYPGVQVIGSGR